MLYYLFSWLDHLNFPGAGLFQFISFRASLALITSLVVSVIIGKRIIARLRRQQIGETVRDLGLAGQLEKSGTPTMGGLIILAAILAVFPPGTKPACLGRQRWRLSWRI